MLFLGANGSGKTVLAKELLNEYARFVALDPKGDLDIPDSVVVHDIRSVRLRYFPRFGSRIIFRPKHITENESKTIMNNLLNRAQKTKGKFPFILYVDEGLFAASRGSKSLLTDVAVIGRSLNIGLWVASQRPRNIPVEVRSEAWRWYIFYLGYREDEREVEQYTKGKLTIEDMEVGHPNEYGFWEVRRIGGGRVQVRQFPALRYQR